jgi:hypothetical protein
METGTIKGLLLSGLIIAAMIVGVVFAPQSRATTPALDTSIVT